MIYTYQRIYVVDKCGPRSGPNGELRSGRAAGLRAAEITVHHVPDASEHPVELARAQAKIAQRLLKKWAVGKERHACLAKRAWMNDGDVLRSAATSGHGARIALFGLFAHS